MSCTYDRFIPVRPAHDPRMQFSGLLLDGVDASSYGEASRRFLFGNQTRVLPLQTQPPPAAAALRRAATHEEKAPFSPVFVRALDAPAISPDSSANNMDWGDSNVVAIVLGDAVYFWGASEERLLGELVSPGTTSLAWKGGPRGYLALGTSEGETKIIDSETLVQLRSDKTREGRVAALAWHGQCICVGGAGGSMKWVDMRERRWNSIAFKEVDEFCGLSCNNVGSRIALGASNGLLVLDGRKFADILYSAKTEVRAIAWHPTHGNVFATGGWVNDQKVHIWSCSGTVMEKQRTSMTGAPVAALAWAGKTLLSCDGPPSDTNEIKITLWKHWTKLEPKAQLLGHTGHILSIAKSPDESTVATTSVDESLRFWKITEPKAACSERRDFCVEHPAIR